MNNIFLVKELDTFYLNEQLNNSELLELINDIEQKNKLIKKKLKLRLFPIELKRTSNNLISLKFNNISGSLKLYKYTFNIIPKFVSNEDSWQKVFFKFINFSNKKIIFPEQLIKQGNKNYTIADLLALVFIDLYDEVLGESTINTYVPEIVESSFLKGRLVVSEQLKVLFNRPGVIINEIDNYSSNNEFNYLIRYTYNRIGSQIKDNKIKNKYSYLKQYLPEVSNKYLLPVLKKLPPQYKKYTKIIDFCNSIILDKKSGGVEGLFTSYSYLINMEKLYEGFVENFINKFSQEKKIEHVSQSKRLFAIDMEKNAKDYNSIPDNIVYFTNGSIIIDAKYKRIKETDGKPEISDVYQIFSACVTYNSSHGILLYPTMNKISNQNESNTWKINTGKKNIYIHSHYLNIEDVLSSKNINTHYDYLEDYLNTLITAE